MKVVPVRIPNEGRRAKRQTKYVKEAAIGIILICSSRQLFSRHFFRRPLVDSACVQRASIRILKTVIAFSLRIVPTTYLCLYAWA